MFWLKFYRCFVSLREAGWLSRYSDWLPVGRSWDRIHAMLRDFSRLQNGSDRIWGSLSHLFKGYRGSFPEGRGVKPKVPMSGAIPLLLYVFMIWMGRHISFLTLFVSGKFCSDRTLKRPFCLLPVFSHVTYRVIQSDCGGFNNLSYTIHLR